MNRPLNSNLFIEAINSMPAQAISVDVLKEKYLKDGEQCVGELFDRVAKALASVEAPELRIDFEKHFRENLEIGAIGAGRQTPAPRRSPTRSCTGLPVMASVPRYRTAVRPLLANETRKGSGTCRRTRVGQPVKIRCKL